MIYKTILAVFLILLFGFMCFSFGATLYSKPTTQTVELPPQIVFSNDFTYFASYTELRVWLDSVKPEIRVAAQPDWNCQDYAWWLFERAIEDGYLMAKYGIRAETYNAAFERQVEKAHAINATFINNHTYLIEPQGLKVFPDFEIEEIAKEEWEKK